MPLGHEILVPRSEFLGVRGARGRALAPDLRLAHAKDGIGNPCDGIAQLLFMDVASTHIAQIRVGRTRISVRQSLEAGIGP